MENQRTFSAPLSPGGRGWLGVCSLAALVAMLLVPSPLFANPADLFGLGAASMGRARTGLVLDHGPFAAWRNPSAMGLAPRDEASLVLFGGGLSLACLGEEISANPRTCDDNILFDGNQDGLVDANTAADRWTPEAVEGPNGFQLGYLRAFGGWLRFGLSINLPLQRIILFEQEDAYLPWYLRWKNRSERIGIYLSGSIRIVDGLYLGVGASILARARIELDFDVDAVLEASQVVDGDDTGSLRADLLINTGNIRADIRPTLSPIASVTWDLGNLTETLRGLRLGVVYRHPVQLDVDPAILNLRFNGVVQEIGSLGDVLIPIQTQIVYAAFDFSTPRQIAVGLGFDRERFAVTGEITWNQWSEVVPNTARIDEELTDIQIGLIDLDTEVLNARQLDAFDFEDTVEVRFGGELRPPPLALSGKVGSRFAELGMVARLGYAFEPSFVPEQTALTNFLDNPTHVISGGFGLWTLDPFGKLGGRISLDFFVQAHILQHRVHRKDPAVLDGLSGTPIGWPQLGEVRSGGLAIIGGGGLHLSI